MFEIITRELLYFWYFFSIQFFQIAPYYAAGAAAGSLISVFGKKKIHTLFAALREKNSGVLALVPASLAGIASPLCMYGTIPLAASFSEKGMEDDTLAAFMMSSVLLNPQLIFYSAALGKAALVIRFASCFLCGVCAGLLVRFFYRGKKFFSFRSFGEGENRDTHPNPLIRLGKNIARNLKATGPAFLLGISLSALFQRYVPSDTVAAFFGKQRLFGLLMAATVGVPLYVCGGGTIPLLAAWIENGMTLGAASAFMISGPAMKITNIGAVKIILPVKRFILYIAFSLLFAFVTGLLVDMI